MLQIAASSANRGGESSSSKPKPFHSELKDAPYVRFTKRKDDRIRHTVAIKQNYNHPPNVGETEIEGTELKDNIERELIKQLEYQANSSAIKEKELQQQWEKEKQMFLKEIERLKKEQEDPLERRNLDELFPPLEGQHHAGPLIEDEVHTALKGEEEEITIQKDKEWKQSIQEQAKEYYEQQKKNVEYERKISKSQKQVEMQKKENGLLIKDLRDVLEINKELIKQLEYQANSSAIKEKELQQQWEKEKQMFLKEIERLKKEQEDPLERRNLDELFPPLEGQHHAGPLIEDEVHTALKGEEGITNHDPKDDALNDELTRNDNFALRKKKWTT
ncbi:hypothetical protein L1987_57766 [Smallanthus sonchifolius]|uniref:Uncharacterized protein n=1 Tax=Smallanthus sonchifolius TaxID=185202 RepID=A0ACB9DDP3_9ASTR|nr:hypothetical protein L1987_57766 [Smallanthus sonchifolius]